MLRSWRLGTAFGIGIYLHWSFAFLVVLVLYFSWGSISGTLISLGLLLCQFGFVVLHELGHSLAARHFGIGTRDITLTPIGGVARLERMSDKPWEELCIALAGPVVNAGLAALFIVLLGVAYLTWNASGGAITPELLASDALSGFSVVMFLFLMVLVNVALCVFNLLPAFPMDGGRVLRALLAMVMPRLTATAIAANIGAVMAVLLAVFGVYSQNYMLLFVAAFVFFAGRQELFMLRHQEMLKNIPEVEPVEDGIDAIDPIAPTALPDRFTGILRDPRTGLWIRWQDGRPIDIVGGRSQD